MGLPVVGVGPADPWDLVRHRVGTGDRARPTTQHEPVTIAPEALPTGALSAVLEEGRQLESGSRWGEALSHYEEALRAHRGNKVLRERHDIAKLHYSLDRRYHDRSFRKSITSLSNQQALSLYSELLSKTSTHYVNSPAWRTLVSRGTRAPRHCLEQCRVPQG